MADDGDCVKEVRHEGSAIVVTLAGVVDLHHTLHVHRALVAACEQRPERLIINLEAVEYMDSSGIGTLVEIYRRVKAFSGKLLLCGLNDRVYSIFEITKLDKFFKICSSEAEALAE